ncbi:MAG: hypothetical protein ACP5F1_01780 [Thermoplasmata archaeon]|nr:hypothetical protein [Thermoplasmata archaeon]
MHKTFPVNVGQRYFTRKGQILRGYLPLTKKTFNIDWHGVPILLLRGW